jgi:5-methylcytosine-specific restriction endonuclease McrA
MAGATGRAADLIRQADMPVLGSWIESLWGKVDPEVHRFRKVPGSPATLPEGARFQPREPQAALKRAVIERDGYHCRFCGIPVVRAEVRVHWRKLQPAALRWGQSNAECHPAFQCLWLQYDHVLPWTRGGRTDLENLVITCAGCNFGRNQWTLEEVAIADPRERPLEPSWPGFDAWDGLERVRSVAGEGRG